MFVCSTMTRVPVCGERTPIEAEVEIARALDRHRFDERRQLHAVFELFRDLARLPFECLRELQCHRRRQIAHRQLRRSLQDDAVDRVPEEDEGPAAKGFRELVENAFENHGFNGSDSSPQNPLQLRACATVKL